jgi:hypothetical protein
MYGKGHDEFACALLLAKPPAVREHQQRGGRVVQGAHEALRVVRCVFEKVVRNPFEITCQQHSRPEFVRDRPSRPVQLAIDIRSHNLRGVV